MKRILSMAIGCHSQRQSHWTRRCGNFQLDFIQVCPAFSCHEFIQPFSNFCHLFEPGFDGQAQGVEPITTLHGGLSLWYSQQSILYDLSQLLFTNHLLQGIDFEHCQEAWQIILCILQVRFNILILIIAENLLVIVSVDAIVQRRTTLVSIAPPLFGCIPLLLLGSSSRCCEFLDVCLMGIIHRFHRLRSRLNHLVRKGNLVL
mmetsp:Transcript_60592/g.136353  ORF Transcript_60592/g.136353 Transcript_60592/m.136353 type:complete len:203 (+) Transcript_60592:1-609(+)